MLVSSVATIVQTSGDEKRGYELEARPRMNGESQRMESRTSKTKENIKKGIRIDLSETISSTDPSKSR